MADGKRKLFCKTTNERIASAINNLEKNMTILPNTRYCLFLSGLELQKSPFVHYRLVLDISFPH